MTSPLPSFDLSSALCAALPRPSPFLRRIAEHARHEAFLPLVRHAEPRLCLTDTSAGRSIVDPMRPLVSVALDPLWTIACVKRDRKSALGPSTRVRALWLMVSNQFRTEGNVA
jgi:hypothetical protein